MSISTLIRMTVGHIDPNNGMEKKSAFLKLLTRTDITKTPMELLERKKKLDTSDLSNTVLSAVT